MSNCILCSAELKFMNTPTFGSGKLSDNGVVCMSCFKKINKAAPKIAGKLKQHSLKDIQILLEADEISKNQKGSKLEQIKEQINSLGLDNTSTFFGRKEIKELPKILAPDEKIDNIIQGIYNKGMGILVSTNRRLVFIDKGMIYGLKVEDFPLDKITSIQYETGLILGEVKIHTSSNIAIIDHVDKNDARKFAEFVRDKISKPTIDSIPQNNSQPNILEQLEKLGKLKESGVLTEEEFNDYKKKLL